MIPVVIRLSSSCFGLYLTDHAGTWRAKPVARGGTISQSAGQWYWKAPRISLDINCRRQP